MKLEISRKGAELIDKISINYNGTVSTPIQDQMQTSSMLKIFLNNTMLTVVVFLIILCIQLIYSLMLSDVEEKTYEFGMLRALGF